MRKSAFEGNLLRLLRYEIQYELENSTLYQVAFWILGPSPVFDILFSGLDLICVLDFLNSFDFSGNENKSSILLY